MWLSVDPLAEQAPDWTPYRYGFNNPIMFTDPTGLFETKAEAKQWAKENDIKTGWFRDNKISKGENGIWSINNKSEGISYSRDPSMADSSTARPDGVIESVYAEFSRSKAAEVNRNPDDLFEVKEGVALWGMASDSGLTTEHKRTSILFSLGMGDVFMRSSAGGTGSKWAYEFLSGMSSREDDFKKGGGLFSQKNKNPYVNHAYKEFGIYQLPYTNKEIIKGMPKDTILRRSEIQKFNAARQYDSLKLVPLLNN